MKRQGEEKEKGAEAIFEALMAENFPQINVRHQAIDPLSSENAKNKCKNQQKTKTTYLYVYHIQISEKSEKKRYLKRRQRRSTFSLEKKIQTLHLTSSQKPC
jgi:hypothetical protein